MHGAARTNTHKVKLNRQLMNSSRTTLSYYDFSSWNWILPRRLLVTTTSSNLIWTVLSLQANSKNSAGAKLKSLMTEDHTLVSVSRERLDACRMYREMYISGPRGCLSSQWMTRFQCRELNLILCFPSTFAPNRLSVLHYLRFSFFFFYPTNQNTEVIICFSKTLCPLEVNTRRTDRCLTGKLRLSINSSSRHSDDLMAEIAPWINIFINNTQWTWKRKISELQRNRQRKQNLTEQTLEYSSWISDPGRPA